MQFMDSEITDVDTKQKAENTQDVYVCLCLAPPTIWITTEIQSHFCLCLVFLP